VWNPNGKYGPHIHIDEWETALHGGHNEEDCVNEYLGYIIGGLGVGALAGRDSDEAEAFRRDFRFEDYPAGGIDPAARLRDMDKDGVSAEILYPSHLRHFYELSAKDEEFFHDIAESYNEWAMEFASYDSKRLIAQPVLSVLNSERAARDLLSYAKRGAKGFIIGSSVPVGMSYGDRRFDTLWRAAVECDVPMAMHATSGRWKAVDYAYELAEDLIGSQAEVQTSLAELIYGGVFDRFPTLKIVCAEYDVGWVAYTVQRVAGFDPSAGLKLAPAEYIRRNVFFSFQDDRLGCQTAHVFGEDNFMWGSDYPHAVTTWPDSKAIVERQFAGVSQTIAQKIAAENAAKLYKLD
jgi:predicted TIM-barrel fold metal-dependent hydrolase